MPTSTNLRRRIGQALAGPGEQAEQWGDLRFHMRLWRYCAHRLWVNNLTAMSAALSFHTIFAMVPLLVLAFLVLKSVGVLEDGKQSLRHLLDASGFAQITLGQDAAATSSPTTAAAETQSVRVVNVADQIESLVDDVESKLTIGRLGPIGAILLIWTALTLLTEIEQALNRIFGAKTGRSSARRMLLYWSVMTLGPLVLITTAYAGRTAIDTCSKLPGIARLVAGAGYLGPAVVSILVVAAVYKLLANTEVPFRAAIAGAIAAVPLWLLAKWAFAFYVRRFVATGNLYGGIGLLPLLLVWLNLSWLIFLFGAELANATANLSALRFSPQADDAGAAPSELLATALAVAGPHVAGHGPVSLGRLAEALRMPSGPAQALVDRLVARGYACRVEAGTVPAYVLARPADRIPVLALLDMGSAGQEMAATRYGPAVASAFARLNDRATHSLGSVTLADLVSPAAS